MVLITWKLLNLSVALELYMLIFSCLSPSFYLFILLSVCVFFSNVSLQNDEGQRFVTNTECMKKGIDF